jgi:hypothetical protein
MPIRRTRYKKIENLYKVGLGRKYLTDLSRKQKLLRKMLWFSRNFVSFSRKFLAKSEKKSDKGVNCQKLVKRFFENVTTHKNHELSF